MGCKVRIILGFIAIFLLHASGAIAQTVDVLVKDYSYTPGSATIKQGDTVKWINKAENQHTVTSGKDGVPDGVFSSKRLQKDESFSYTFESPGIFTYFCTPHNAFGMKGTVEVKAADAE